jgi:hypothetical protein
LERLTSLLLVKNSQFAVLLESPRLKCLWQQIKFRLHVFPLQLQQGRDQAALRDKIIRPGRIPTINRFEAA